ncbi:hypothetical protein DFJ73DRAFT_802011, partial [Zopfochytrium polystomum]
LSGKRLSRSHSSETRHEIRCAYLLRCSPSWLPPSSFSCRLSPTALSRSPTGKNLTLSLKTSLQSLNGTQRNWIRVTASTLTATAAGWEGSDEETLGSEGF